MKVISQKRTGALATVASLTALIAAIVINYAANAVQLFLKREPVIAHVLLMQEILLLISAWLLVFAITCAHSGAKSRKAAEAAPLALTFEVGRLGTIRIPAALLLGGNLALIIAIVALFVASPAMFSALSVEDQPVEMLSALFLFLASGYCAFLAFQTRLPNRTSLTFVTAALFALSIVFFVIGMEEVSWLQRFLSISTPAGFRANSQHEINLHNFATSFTEFAYYSAAFVFLVLLPFVSDQTGLLDRFKSIVFFVPSPTIILIGAPLVAFNYSLWNYPETQFAFFVTLFILLYLVYRSFRDRAPYPAGKYYLLALLAVYLFSQVIFILRGDTFVRDWEVTEYKEFFIALTFAIYSLELVVKARKSIPVSYTLLTVLIGLLLLGLRLLPKLRG